MSENHAEIPAKEDTDQVDAIVVGAGVVGLACARALALSGSLTMLVEAESSFGQHSSSRNSEVVHAGFYYLENSAKTRFCIRGRQLLYQYCDEKNVPYAKVGKVVVAVDKAEESRLHDLLKQGQRNGVEGLGLLNTQQLARIEPAVKGHAALHSRETGIVDSHQFMASLARDFKEAGGLMACQSPVIEASVTSRGFSIGVGGREPSRLDCRRIVNAAGLGAESLARMILGGNDSSVPRTRFVKGNYFGYNGPCPFKGLVYPLPQVDGLGIHATRDLAGALRFGPDVENCGPETNYNVNPNRRDAFEQAIRRYWPELAATNLHPDYAGIRCKQSLEGSPASDFLIQSEASHGQPGLVNLLAIESPGLTAALALAEEVMCLLEL